MLGQLIWKDLRVCLFPLVAGVALIVGSFCIAYWVLSDEVQRTSGVDSKTLWAARVGLGSLFSGIVSQLSLAMIAGALIATERGDGTSRFLESLPIPRSRILSSKILVLFGCVVVAALITGGGIEVFRRIGDQPFDFDIGMSLAPVIAFGAAAIGISWFASAFLRSAAFSVAIGIASPLTIMFGLMIFAYNFDVINPRNYPLIYETICWGVGIGGFIAGSVCFLRRMEY